MDNFVMVTNFPLPEEDSHLCQHDWTDLYAGSGVDRTNPEVALATFYCKKCLDIRIKSYSQSRFKLSPEIYED